MSIGFCIVYTVLPKHLLLIYMQFCVGFGIAYPQLMGMREPYKRDKHRADSHASFLYVSCLVLVMVIICVLGINAVDSNH